MTEILYQGNLAEIDGIENNKLQTFDLQLKKKFTESTISLFRRIMDGSLGWTIGAIFTVFLFAGNQALHNDSVTEPKKELNILNGQDEQMISKQVGALTIIFPKTWEILSGSEAKQAKSQIENNVQQRIEQYKSETDIEHGDFGIGEFCAIRIPNNSGWCILYVTEEPPLKNYYQTYMKESAKKLEFGLQQGIYTKVIENGIVKIEDKEIVKTILQTKDAGRLINFIYWSPSTPSVLTYLSIVESKIDQEFKNHVDQLCNSLQVN